MKKKLSALALSLVFCLCAAAQFIYPPEIQCVIKSNDNIIISWSNPTNNCGPFVQYTIYASSTGPNGPFNPIAVTTQGTTVDTLFNYLTISPDWWFYMESDFNCPGATVLQSDTVDSDPPAVPEIVNVTVTANGDVIFNWLPSTSNQTQGYVIYNYLVGSGNAVPLDTVYGQFSTTYTDTVRDPTVQVLNYTIAAFDSCQQFGSYSNLYHNTLFLQAATGACQNQVNLNWNKYIHWPLGVFDYQVWASINGGPFNLVGSVDSSLDNYAYSNFNDGDSLCIIIRARSLADTTIISNSNMVCLRASIIKAPAFIFITNATVGLDNHNYVTWNIDTTAELTFFKIERSTNNSSFTDIDQWPAINFNPFDTYEDSTNVRPQDNPYYYTVTVFDSCQNKYASPYVKTINLKGELFDYYVAHLTWNDFELQHATVLKQNLYRNYGPGYQLVKTFAPGVNEYSDSLQQFVDEKGIFCYYIESVYDLDLPNGYHDTLTSNSNEQCIIHRPIIYIPNAFAPGGVNTVFKPTIIYGNPTGYIMTIFNRWGGEVFSSNDPSIGWDGTDHGKEAMAGGYAYLIQFYAEDGVKVERKGMVLLVK